MIVRPLLGIDLKQAAAVTVYHITDGVIGLRGGLGENLS